MHPKSILLDDKSLYWLAGILEGEGWFGFNRGSPVVSVAMVDRDVIERVQDIMYTPSIFKSERSGRQAVYGTQSFKGTGLESILVQLFPLMSKRRQERIQELLDAMPAIGPSRNRKYHD